MTAIKIPARIEGSRCALRPLTDADLAAYAQAFVDDPELALKIGIESGPDAARLAGRPQMIDPGAVVYFGSRSFTLLGREESR